MAIILSILFIIDYFYMLISYYQDYFQKYSVILHHQILNFIYIL